MASVATTRSNGEEEAVFPDTLVGTDSHTPHDQWYWGTGLGNRVELTEACMLGQPLYFLVPDVIGFRLTGSLPVGATATDLVLTITEL